MTVKSYRIDAVLFDFDGTLTRPGAIDFALIRQAIDCPEGVPVLEYIRSLPTLEAQKRAHAQLEQFEIEAARKSVPNDGAVALIRFLQRKNIPTAIITRNSLRCVDVSLENFDGLSAADFDLIITRDEPIKPKPSGDGVRLAARKLNVVPANCLMVGDFVFDIEAGCDAGALTALIDSRIKSPFPSQPGDFNIDRLDQLVPIIRLGLPLAAGKLPNELLQTFLGSLPHDDSQVLVYPGVGEDTAAVNVSDEEVLVLKSDPITFATEAISRYAVMVNANDIATSGARPRWFLTTLLFPCGTTGAEVKAVMAELQTVCRQSNITLCGGHTEITDAVTRPVVIGMLSGTVSRDRLLDKRNIAAGDKILLTKAVAVEGTAIIAREFGPKLIELGMSAEEIQTCRGFLSHIGILDEAHIAADSGHVSGMHDVTEGGLATALEELSMASGHGIRVDMDQIPIFPETEKIGRLLEIDPLGLIGSGSLLIACKKGYYRRLMDELDKAGIRNECIGEMQESGSGVQATRGSSPATWPRFEVDEIARLFSA